MSSPLAKSNSVSIDPYIQGDVAAGSTDSGNPIKIGGIASTAIPTAAANGQRVNAYFDQYGYTMVKAYAQGMVAAGQPDSGNPQKIGGLASANLPISVTDQSRVNAYFDLNGRQHVVVDAFSTTANFTQGVYQSSPPVLSNGQVAQMQLDSSGNQKVTLATKIAGEDLTNDVMKVEGQFSFANITAAAPTTTVVKASAGLLHSIVINKAIATGSITIYNNTAGSGAYIGTITMPAAVLGSQICLIYDCLFTIGLTIVTATAAQDLTVNYR